MIGSYRDDGRQSLYGPSAQSDVWENVLLKACFQKNPIGVVPDLKKNYYWTFSCYLHTFMQLKMHMIKTV